MHNGPIMMAAAIALLAAAPASAADPSTMEVAGIRLGASSPQVKEAFLALRAAAIAAATAVDPFLSVPSFTTTTLV